MTTAVATKLIPLIESFGPTIQGEGYLAGLPTLFLRFGLCDYRCEWCDSKYAVEPELVKRDAERLTQGELLDRVRSLSENDRMWITLSGGNPAMHDLTDFVADARAAGYLTSVETQGSIWRDWLGTVDHLTVSPKPPSSGMVNEKHERMLLSFLDRASALPAACRSLKIVVFDDADLEWARLLVKDANEVGRGWHTYLSVGTPSVSRWGSEVYEAVTDRHVRDTVGDQYRWLCERVAADPVFVGTRVLPQLHVVAWGHSKGV